MGITHEAMVKVIVETLEATDGAGSDLVTGWRNGEWLHIHGNLDVHHLASDVIEATQPRTITTVEELDALPRDSVVLGFGLGERTPYLRAVSARGIITWGCVGSTDCHDSAHLLLDNTAATVLYEPTN